MWNIVLLILCFSTCFALVLQMVENGVLMLGSGVYSYCLPFLSKWDAFIWGGELIDVSWKPDNILPGQGDLLYKDFSTIGDWLCDPCCDFDLKTDSYLYDLLLSFTQGPGTFIFKRKDTTLIALRLTIQHKDAPAYSTQTNRISAIRPYLTDTDLDWCTGSEMQNSICNNAFMQSRFQGACGNCWAQAAVAILEFTAARYSRLILSPDWSLSVEDVSIRFQSASRHRCEGNSAPRAINKAIAFGVFMIDADPSYPSVDAYSKEDKEKMYSLPSVKWFNSFGFKMRLRNRKVIKGYPKLKTDYADAKRMFFRGYCTYFLCAIVETEEGQVSEELVHDITRKIAEYGPAIVYMDSSYISRWNYTKQIDFETDPNLVYGRTSLERSSCKSKVANIIHAAVLVGYGVTPDGTSYWIVRHTHNVRWFRILRDVTNMCGVLNRVTFLVPCDKPAIRLSAIGPDAYLDSRIGTGIWVGNNIKDRTVKSENIISLDNSHENPFQGVIGGAGGDIL